jgi:hypothetical protein
MQHKNKIIVEQDFYRSDVMLCEEDCVLGNLNRDCLSVVEDLLMSPVKFLCDRKRSKHKS